MMVFLTGATGYIGSAVAGALLHAGHSVIGLARSDEAAGQLHLSGIGAHRGDLTSPTSVIAAASAADATIHTGTTNDGSIDRRAVDAMLQAVTGSGKPFVYTSGVWVLGDTGDKVADETWPVRPLALVAWRPALEQLVLETAQRNVRAIVIRPAVVYGRGAGIPADFVKSARETGAARYVGPGTNRWPVIHVDDLASLYLAAMEKAPAATLLHAADGSAHRVKEIAEAASIGAGAGGSTESWPLEEARKTLGAYADALALDQQVSAEKARAMLGWKPRAASILEDLRHGSYTQ
jgi:nucleoside-diphosphate-sugar epimerase